MNFLNLPLGLLKFSLAVSVVFSTAFCFADPLTGAFVEGAIGGSISNNQLETVTTCVQCIQVGATQSVNKDKSKSAFTGRVGVGYGYSLRNNFNLTGLLAYSPSQSADDVYKNGVSLLLQPGFHISSARTLVYGTVGYATASFNPSPRSIAVNDRVLNVNAQGTALQGAVDSRNSPQMGGGGNLRAKGLVLGLGAKYAATNRFYAGFDYTHTFYRGGTREGDVRNWEDREVRNDQGTPPPSCS